MRTGTRKVKISDRRLLLRGVILALSALLWGAPALAANSTTAGTATASPGSARLSGGSLVVKAPYTGDDDGDNTLKIEWGEDGVNFSLGNQTLTHAASPYSYTITGLDNTKKYQVRVTWQDIDNGTNPQQTLTGLRPYVTLLHNAVSTGSGTNKWAGGWGTADGTSKYGEFTCATCHGKTNVNVKRVKKTIVSPKPEDTFPGSTVTFEDVRDGTSHFGNDSGGHLSSYKVCEICHTKTSYHRYDTTGQPGGNDHYNQYDCLICHKHSDAFKANCTSCHGDPTAGNSWPDATPGAYADRAGAHASHVQAIGNWLASGNKDNATFTTLSHKNGSCNFCHPNPGGPNASGGQHSDNTTGSPANVADAFGDGWNAAGFRNFSGGTDVDGSYNPTIKRCSNVDCHSNGDFTWTWYPDVIPPGQITDLAASTGTEVGTVNLSWTPPPNDGSTGPIAYGYQVRYRTGGAVTDANWDTATIAGGPPSLVRTYPDNPRTQTMTVYGLTPGTTYYFGVKAFDEVPTNLSPASNSPSAQAKTDTYPPVFQGIGSAVPAYATGAVDLEWGAASDDTGPVTYLVYWSLANQSINYASPNATTRGLKFQVTGLTNGLDYKFAVRARDASPAQNTDTNTKIKEAIPQVPSEKEILGKMYYAVNSTSSVSLGGASTSSTLTCSEISWGGSEYRSLLNTSGYTCSDGTKVGIKGIGSYTGNIITWVFNTTYAKKTNIHGATFSLYIKEKSDTTGNSATFDLGYWNPSNGTFNTLDTVTKTLGKKSRGSVKAYFPNVDGTVVQVPANMKLAIRLRKTNSKEFEIRYGSNKGDSMLSVYEQENNDLPGTFSVTTPGSPSSGVVNLSWTAATDPDGDQVTYDVYGSIDNGSTWPYLVARGLTTTSTSWNTRTAGIGLTAQQDNVRFRVGAADGMLHRIFSGDPGGLPAGSLHDHRYTASNAFSINNTGDSVAPAAITDLAAEHRPKTGTVWLYWHAPGDDGKEGKASQYDIRYKLSDPYNAADVIDSEAKWTAATQVTAEPVPVAPGLRQGYEVLGLVPGKKYFFAIKTADEVNNWSPLSNSPSSTGGLGCGVCHSTPPDDLATSGTHDEHGYTQTDCAKCHGQEADTFGMGHMDGVTRLAWNNPKKGYTNTAVGPTTQTDTSVVYKNEAGTYTTYSDSTGGGGFNDLDPNTGDNKDTGTCFSFNQTGVTGCHGPGTPVWGNRSSVTCAMCHGNMSRGTKDPYGRNWEDTRTDTKYAGNVPFYKSAPAVDLLGNTLSNAVGQHERHLNFSYRLTGDQCVLCHKGYDHADGTVDVYLDKGASGENAQWVPGTGGNPGTCIGTSEMRCHGDNATAPPWKTRNTEPNGTKIIACNECHGHEDNNFWLGAAVPITEHTATTSAAVTGNGSTTTISVQSGHTMAVNDRIIKGSTYFVVTATTSTSLTFHKAIPAGINFANGEVLKTKHIPHVSDGGQVRACTWCHVEGHPQGDETTAGTQPAGQETVFIPNNSVVGLDYTSGGIHLRKTINGRGPFNTEAEICWGCHDAQNPKISEWGFNGISNSKVVEGAITGVTKASPASVTSNSHGLATGDRIIIYMPNGMIELNGWTGKITVTGANTFTLNGVNSSGWSTTFSSTGAKWKLATVYDWGVLHGNSGSWGSRTKTSNWVTGTWDSPHFPYKTGAIVSTHSVNSAATRPGMDTVAQIRCSYCHDVHDMNRAPGDTVDGRPFLRGTWQGNPYLEDGAPGRFKGYYDLASAANKAQYYSDGGKDDFGMVPRGSTAMVKMGGYWIDQNSGYPTAKWNLQNSAGICTLCHGTDVNNMNKFNVQADGTAESTKKSWIGTNGHSNAVLGGSGLNKFNVYDPTFRSEGTTYNDPAMAYQGTLGYNNDAVKMFGLRNNEEGSTYISDTNRTSDNNMGVYPYAWSTTSGKNAYAYEEFSWGLNRDTGSTAGEPMYHRFSCSKCHNPHASRLPRLMITNCLDISHNKWDDNFSGDPDWTSGATDGTAINWSTTAGMTAHGTGNDVSGIGRNKQFAYATSAQNCHRYVDTNGDADGDDAGEAPGWNKITPWIESGTNYTNN